MIWQLAPDSEPPEQEEEAQSEVEEEAVLGIEIGWILPALRRRGRAWPEVTGEGHGSSASSSAAGHAGAVEPWLDVEPPVPIP